MRNYGVKIAAIVAGLLIGSTGWGNVKSPGGTSGGGGGSGTVTSASVATANGFAGTVATATTTPAITISTTVTGLLLGNGSSVAAAAAANVVGLFSGTCSATTVLHGGGACGAVALGTDVSGALPIANGGTGATSLAAAQTALGVAPLLYEWGTPAGIAPSGTMANNGVVTLGTALFTTFPKIWLWFPANAIFTGSTGAEYYVQCTTTTACTVFNNTLAAGTLPSAVPGTPTPFVTTGPGAYTQTINVLTPVVAPSIPGGTIGTNGAVRISTQVIVNNTAGGKSLLMTYGGSTIQFLTMTSQNWAGTQHTVRNLGNAASQIVISGGSGTAAIDTTLSGSTPQSLTINTASAVVVGLELPLGVATDWAIVLGGSIEILPAP